MNSLVNIFWLGLKEMRSLLSDKVMVIFVIYAFTLAIHVQATGTSSEVNNASIAFVDEDESILSKEIINAFFPPRFKFPEKVPASEVEDLMDKGLYMFVVAIPPRFEEDLRAGRNPSVQVSIDATAMQQAGIGAGYIRNIVTDRIASVMRRTEEKADQPIQLVVRKLFNPNAVSSWYKSVVAIINQISLLTVILTGAAVIREREHGTLEHLLVMPLTAFEIAMAKVWANSLVILVATAISLFLIVQMALKVPFAGSRALWFLGVVLYLFFGTALGIYPRHHLEVDGAVRAAHHPGHRRDDAAVGRLDPGGEPAEVAAGDDLLPAVAALRELLAGDRLPRRRARGLLEAVRDGDGDRARVLRLQPVAVPQVDRGDQVGHRELAGASEGDSSMDAVTLRRYEALSPFEIKNDLAKVATKSAKAAQMAYLNAGRGNPNWIATEPRSAFFLLGQFAITESQRTMDLPGVGGMPKAAGVGGAPRWPGSPRGSTRPGRRSSTP